MNAVTVGTVGETGPFSRKTLRRNASDGNVLEPMVIGQAGAPVPIIQGTDITGRPSPVKLHRLKRGPSRRIPAFTDPLAAPPMRDLSRSLRTAFHCIFF